MTCPSKPLSCLAPAALCGLAVIAAIAMAPAGVAAVVPPTAITIVPVDSLPLPPGEVTGLAWRGPDTLAVLVKAPAGAGERIMLSLHDRAGALLQKVDVTGTAGRGLAYDGTSFWVAGDDAEGGSHVVRIDADTLEVEDTYPLRGHRPMALTWDGSSVWVSDRDSGRLDRVDPTTGDITRSVLSPGFSPCGVAWDGRAMWVTDSATGLLYRLTGPRREWSATVTADAFFHRGEDVLLLHDGNWLWYVRPGSSWAIRARII
ncbi:MAG: hypothetical protein R6X25_16250 [Candidatus Krumholzibacteriia bacterium]